MGRGRCAWSFSLLLVSYVPSTVASNDGAGVSSSSSLYIGQNIESKDSVGIYMCTLMNRLDSSSEGH